MCIAFCVLKCWCWDFASDIKADRHVSVIYRQEIAVNNSWRVAVSWWKQTQSKNDLQRNAKCRCEPYDFVLSQLATITIHLRNVLWLWFVGWSKVFESNCCTPDKSERVFRSGMVDRASRRLSWLNKTAEWRREIYNPNRLSPKTSLVKKAIDKREIFWQFFIFTRMDLTVKNWRLSLGNSLLISVSSFWREFFCLHVSSIQWEGRWSDLRSKRKQSVF